MKTKTLPDRPIFGRLRKLLGERFRLKPKMHEKYEYQELRRLKMVEWFSRDDHDGVHICRQIFQFMRAKNEDIDDIVSVDWQNQPFYVWTTDRVYSIRLGFADSANIITVTRNPIAGSSKLREECYGR